METQEILIIKVKDQDVIFFNELLNKNGVNSIPIKSKQLLGDIGNTELVITISALILRSLSKVIIAAIKKDKYFQIIKNGKKIEITSKNVSLEKIIKKLSK